MLRDSGSVGRKPLFRRLYAFVEEEVERAGFPKGL